MWLLIRASLLLGAYLLLQPVVPLPKLLRLFEPRKSRRRERISVADVVRLVDGMLRRIYRRDYCMKRSVLLYRFLVQRGNDARICFGVVKQQDRLSGHAWVEVAGEPFCESTDPRSQFTTTFSYPDRHTELPKPSRTADVVQELV